MKKKTLLPTFATLLLLSFSLLSLPFALSLSLLSLLPLHISLFLPLFSTTHTHTQCSAVADSAKREGQNLASAQSPSANSVCAPFVSPLRTQFNRAPDKRILLSLAVKRGKKKRGNRGGEERKKEKGEQRRNCFERKWRRVISSFSLLCATHCGASLQRSLRRAAHHTPPPHSPRWAKFWHDPPLPLAWPPFFPSSFTAAPSPAYATP